MHGYVAFHGPRRLASGAKLEVAQALKQAEGEGGRALFAFDLDTGAPVDFDLRGGEAEIAERYGESERGRGRPKLGVVAREVTLLPRHWDWLNAQRGGASAALRRLVDSARQADRGATDADQAKAAAYRFLSAMAGNLPQFEEAARALFADDLDAFRMRTADWPGDIVDVALERLASLPT